MVKGIVYLFNHFFEYILMYTKIYIIIMLLQNGGDKVHYLIHIFFKRPPR